MGDSQAVVSEQARDEKPIQQPPSDSPSPITNPPNKINASDSVNDYMKMKAANAAKGKLGVFELLEASGLGSVTSKAISKASHEDRNGYTKEVKEDKDTSELSGKLGIMDV